MKESWINEKERARRKKDTEVVLLSMKASSSARRGESQGFIAGEKLEPSLRRRRLVETRRRHRRGQREVGRSGWLVAERFSIVVVNEKKGRSSNRRRDKVGNLRAVFFVLFIWF